MRNSSYIPGIVLAAMVAATPAHAQEGGAVKESEPGLLRQAKVSPDSARRLALSRVPGGKVVESEIEREHGALIYSFDIKVAGHEGIEEVNVDAGTGVVAAPEHESDEAEAAEESAEHGPITISEDEHGLLAQATIKPDSAMLVARGRVPGGHITKGEIENEDGKLVYSFILKVAGKAGVEEVNVDARTGAVVSIEHENH